MKKAILALFMAFLSGCGSKEVAVFEANPNFSDQDMALALEKEGAFCASLAQGEGIAYVHVNNLPPRGYKANFGKLMLERGYTDRMTSSRKSFADYRDAARLAGEPEANAKEEVTQARYESCMRSLGWKAAQEVTGRERLEIDKNNRALALAERMKNDPMAERSIKMMSINLDRLSLKQAQAENRKLFADPSVFEREYLSTRGYVRRNRKDVDSKMLAASIGHDFARCSALYNVINENRTEQLRHNIQKDDRLLSMEQESFYYATRFMHVDTAQREKREYTREYKESGSGLSQILLRFKEESSQCAIMLQGFKKVSFKQP